MLIENIMSISVELIDFNHQRRVAYISLKCIKKYQNVIGRKRFKYLYNKIKSYLNYIHVTVFRTDNFFFMFYQK